MDDSLRSSADFREAATCPLPPIYHLTPVTAAARVLTALVGLATMITLKLKMKIITVKLTTIGRWRHPEHFLQNFHSFRRRDQVDCCRLRTFTDEWPSIHLIFLALLLLESVPLSHFLHFLHSLAGRHPTPDQADCCPLRARHGRPTKRNPGRHLLLLLLLLQATVLSSEDIALRW